AAAVAAGLKVGPAVSAAVRQANGSLPPPVAPPTDPAPVTDPTAGSPAPTGGATTPDPSSITTPPGDATPAAVPPGTSTTDGPLAVSAGALTEPSLSTVT